MSSVLAVHPGALGDVVLFGHLLARINAPVTLVAGGEKARLLAGLGVARTGLDFESLPMQEVFSDAPVASCRLAAVLGGFDRLISCFATGEAGTERRLGELSGAREAAFLPTRPPVDFDGHLLDLWRGLLGLAGEPPPPGGWPVPDAWRAASAASLASCGLAADRPYVAIHPGAGAERKCWPLDRFLAVASHVRDAGGGVVFLAGPVELDRWRDGRLDRLAGSFPLLAGAGLPVVAAVLAGATGYVGNDSGVSHLAAAIGTRTLALFGPTDARHFRPWGPNVDIRKAPRLDDIDAEEIQSLTRDWLRGERVIPS